MRRQVFVANPMLNITLWPILDQTDDPPPPVVNFLLLLVTSSKNQIR